MGIKLVKPEIVGNAGVLAMCKALRKAGMGVIKDSTTLIVLCSGNVTEVMRGIRQGYSADPWLLRRANGLFESDGLSKEDSEKVCAELKRIGGIGNAKPGATT